MTYVIDDEAIRGMMDWNDVIKTLKSNKIKYTEINDGDYKMVIF